MRDLNPKAELVLNLPAVVEVFNHLVLLDRDQLSDTSHMKDARYRWILFDISAEYFGEYSSYNTREDVDNILRLGIGA